MKKYIRAVVALALFVVFAAAAVLFYFEEDYIRARSKVKYLNSELGQTGIRIEDSINKLSGKNDYSAHREWQQTLDRAEDKVSEGETKCLITGSLAVVSLGGSIVFFVLDKKKGSN